MQKITAEQGNAKVRNKMGHLSLRGRAYLEHNPTMAATDGGYEISKKQRKEIARLYADQREQERRSFFEKVFGIGKR